ncbi:MAG: NnrU family protein [Beijerinckiaceae bacterium]
MTLLIAGLMIFFAGHAVTMARSLRASLIQAMGEGPYKLAYSAASAIGLVMIVWGFASYRASGYIPVWTPPKALTHIALLLNVPVFILLAAAYLPGRIKTAAKHPMLLAVKIWATAHLLANGDLGSMLLFGAFLAWAVIARISAKKRGESIPGHALVAPSARNDGLAIVVGLAAYALMAFWLHPLLIGVPVISR